MKTEMLRKIEKNRIKYPVEECKPLKQVNVAAAIIRREGKILATQRNYGQSKDGWEFPGGKIEDGETPQQALIREVKEELNVIVNVGELEEVVEYDYPDFHLTMHCFWCSIQSGEPVLIEHQAAKWLAPSELGCLEWLPADVELIEKLLYNYTKHNWSITLGKRMANEYHSDRSSIPGTPGR